MIFVRVIHDFPYSLKGASATASPPFSRRHLQDLTSAKTGGTRGTFWSLIWRFICVFYNHCQTCKRCHALIILYYIFLAQYWIKALYFTFPGVWGWCEVYEGCDDKVMWRLCGKYVCVLWRSDNEHLPGTNWSFMKNKQVRSFWLLIHMLKWPPFEHHCLNSCIFTRHH